jgi:magnesium chelatase family protein
VLGAGSVVDAAVAHRHTVVTPSSRPVTHTRAVAPYPRRMVARACTFWLAGVDARRVEVEAHLQRGVPAFVLVGLADRSVQEARERVRSGVLSAEFEFPLKRLTVNLAPAEERKEGAGFDLAIALAVLAASGQAPRDRVARVAAAAELGLDGRLRPVRGALAMAEAAGRAGLDALVVAPANAAEAALAGGIAVLAAESLRHAVDIPGGRAEPSPVPAAAPMPAPAVGDLGEVRGQATARRAIEIAAAGGHNLLMVGPPGSGKTMLARRLPGILPPPTVGEAIEITRIHSAAGLLALGFSAAARPFRAPHHSASAAALVGGASLRPGEVTLAHRGVLFLDELPEFTRPALEALRQPLEDGEVVVARAAVAVRMPARCTVVAAMNPCPCGRSGDPELECACPPQRLDGYRARVSGPLRDRFDLHVEVPRLAAHGAPGEPSATVAERVASARAVLAERPPRAGQEATALLDRARRARLLSGRGAARIARVAATIAALAASPTVAGEHVAEALRYRDAPA